VLIPLLKTHIAAKAAWPPVATARPGNLEERNSSAPADAPDASAEFRSEFAALLAFYAARIAAARASLDPRIAAAIVQALLNEQAIALRGLTERQHAAMQKKKAEKPERPTANTQKKDDNPRPP